MDKCIIWSVYVHVWHEECKKRTLNGRNLLVSLVSVIFKSINEELFVRYFFASKIFETIAVFKQN